MLLESLAQGINKAPLNTQTGELMRSHYPEGERQSTRREILGHSSTNNTNEEQIARGLSSRCVLSIGGKTTRNKMQGTKRNPSKMLSQKPKALRKWKQQQN